MAKRKQPDPDQIPAFEDYAELVVSNEETRVASLATRAAELDQEVGLTPEDRAAIDTRLRLERKVGGIPNWEDQIDAAARQGLRSREMYTEEDLKHAFELGKQSKLSWVEEKARILR